jgi:hypothetical protein
MSGLGVHKATAASSAAKAHAATLIDRTAQKEAEMPSDAGLTAQSTFVAWMKAREALALPSMAVSGSHGIQREIAEAEACTSSVCQAKTPKNDATEATKGDPGIAGSLQAVVDDPITALEAAGAPCMASRGQGDRDDDCDDDNGVFLLISCSPCHWVGGTGCTRGWHMWDEAG